MILLRLRSFLGLILGGLCTPVWALNIVATIPPVGALAMPLVSSDDQVSVILSAGQSPHGFQMRPSHRLQLERADIILAVGSGVDGWADKVLKSMPEKVIWMQNLPGLVKFTQRNDAKWPKHQHDEPAHEETHQHDAHESSEMAMSYLRQDPHIWLSPENGRLMANAIAQRLSILSPDQSQNTQKALQVWVHRLAEQEAQINQTLQAVKSRPFIVLHDAFQYFEKHFDLNGVGAIQINPELKPSLQKVLALRHQIEQEGVVCVFKEPQFPAKQVAYVVEGLNVNIGELDPLGRQTPLQPYDKLLQNLADSFRQCLIQKTTLQ